MVTKEDSTYLRGYLIIMIMLAHIFAKCGYNIAGTFLRIILPSNVSFFLFSTGYGLIFQLKNKGHLYLTGFIRDKILLKLSFPYIVAILFYIVILALFNEPIDILGGYNVSPIFLVY